MRVSSVHPFGERPGDLRFLLAVSPWMCAVFRHELIRRSGFERLLLWRALALHQIFAERASVAIRAIVRPHWTSCRRRGAEQSEIRPAGASSEPLHDVASPYRGFLDREDGAVPQCWSLPGWAVASFVSIAIALINAPPASAPGQIVFLTLGCCALRQHPSAIILPPERTEIFSANKTLTCKSFSYHLVHAARLDLLNRSMVVLVSCGP